LSIEVLAKVGALVSSGGVALLATFVVVLIAFPVTKECNSVEKCSYTSKAPERLAALVQPEFLAISLMLIAAGVLLLRFSRWKTDKETKDRL